MGMRNGASNPGLAVAAALLAVAGAAACFAGEAQMNGSFHVATDGNDANPGSKEKPFATLARARDAVRERIRAGQRGNLTVSVRGGTYELKEPLVFGPQDGGDGTFTVTYAAAPGDTPVFSGGRAVAGWKKADGGLWTAEVPGVKAGKLFFRQLFVDGARALRCRYPNEGKMLRVAAVSEDVKTISFNEPLGAGDLAGQDTELVAIQDWSITRARVASSGEKSVVTATPHGWIGHGKWTTTSPGKAVYLEHARAFLDTPGEWFLDRAAGTLLYQAASGEDPNRKAFVAPVLEQWLVLAGTRGQPVRGLVFEGLSFEHAEFPLPEVGYAEIQAGHYGTAVKEPMRVPAAAVECLWAEDCRFERCRFAHAGSAAIGFGAGCRRNKVNGCRIEDIGGNGIMVGWRGKGELQGTGLDADWKDPADAPSGNQVTNNLIQRCGAVCHGSVGVYVAFAPDTRVACNLVRDMPYTGISIGFRWNPTESTMKNAVVERNHIHDVMRMLSDGGAVYSLGFQPGTVLRANHIHDVHRGEFAIGAPNNGFFVDEGSKGFLFERNLVYGTTGGPVRFNNCQEDWHTWKDNYLGGKRGFAEGMAGQALLCDGGGLDVPHDGKLEPEKFTLGAWIWLSAYPEDGDNRRWIVNKNGNEWTDGHYALAIAGKEACAYLNIGGGRENCFEARSAKAPLKLDEWQHLAVTYDGAALRVFAGGAEVATTAVNRKRQPGNTALVLGRRQDGFATSAFRGRIDEVRLYDRALDAAGIRALAQRPKDGKASAEGLIQAWSFDEEKAEGSEKVIREAGPEAPYREYFRLPAPEKTKP